MSQHSAPEPSPAQVRTNFGGPRARLIWMLVGVRYLANIGLTLSIGGVPIIERATFSAVVAMVIVTTVITPPALTWSLGRTARRASLSS